MFRNRHRRPVRLEPTIRRFAASLLVIVGVVLSAVANVSWYANELFYDRDAFVTETVELAANDDIVERITEGFTSELLGLAGQEIMADDNGDDFTIDFGDALPESETNATIFEDALNATQQDIVTATVEAMLASDAYLNEFERAAGKTHDQLLDSIDGSATVLSRNNGQVVFDLSELYTPMLATLSGEAATLEISDMEIPPNAGQFAVVDRSSAVEWIWSWLERANEWSTLMTVMSVVAIVAAVIVADRRPWAMIVSGGGVAALAAIVVVVIFVLRAIMAVLVGGGSSSGPTTAVYAQMTWPLVTQSIWVIGMGGALALLGGFTRLIWPDDWVYSHYDDGDGPRSIRRRPGVPDLSRRKSKAPPMGPQQGPVSEPFANRPTVVNTPAPAPRSAPAKRDAAPGWDYGDADW